MQLTLDELKDKNDADDVVIESQGIKIVYHSDIEGYVKDSVVDYETSWFKRGFLLRGSQMSSC